MTKNLQSSCQELDRLLHAKVFGPIINTSVFFSEFSSKKLLAIQFLISTIHSVSFANFHWVEKKYRAEYHQHNSES